MPAPGLMSAIQAAQQFWGQAATSYMSGAQTHSTTIAVLNEALAARPKATRNNYDPKQAEFKVWCKNKWPDASDL